MRVLIFGDSIAVGMWDVRGGWVQILRAEFDTKSAADFMKDFPTVYNLGISADNSAGVLARIEQETEARKRPELAIVVAIGTNDASDSRVHIDLENYEKNLRQIIAQARKFTGKILFVGLPGVDEARTNPWFVDRTAAYTNGQLQTYERALQEICESEHAPFVPIFERFQSEQAKRDLLPDGLHPSTAGHEFIANLVRPELNKLLAS